MIQNFDYVCQKLSLSHVKVSFRVHKSEIQGFCVFIRKLKNEGLHTFSVMVGYCLGTLIEVILSLMKLAF